MSSDLDKFVLQYQVELKDSIARLEKLNNKVAETEQKSKGAGRQLGDFAKGATNEIGKLVPAVNSVTTAVSGMSKGFTVATLALAGLGAGVAALIKMRDQYNNQRLVGQEVGVSGLRIEEYQRKLQKHGAGYTTRAQTEAAVKSITGKASAAYTDPTRMGAEARLFNMLGIDVGQRGKGSRSGNAIITDVAKKLAGSTEAEAQAYGAQLGLSPDITKAMRKAGASMGSITEMSAKDVQSRLGAQKELDKFNDATAKLSEQFTILANQLAEKILPAFTKMIGWFTADPKIASEADREKIMGGNTAKARLNRAQERLLSGARAAAERSKIDAETAKKNQETVDQAAENEDAAFKNGKQEVDEFQLAINMFSGAVSAFSNAVDERQAMAAWAGEIGKAAGLGGAAPEGSFQAKLAGPSPYDALFSAAEAKHNLPAGILKRIAGVESSYNPNAVSPAGAQGLMQLMPANSKAFGISNPLDPEANIGGGARLFADYLRRSGGDVRQALRMYHGGLKESGWGPLTMAYPDKVMNFGSVGASGESKANIRLKQTYDNIAAALGVDPKQLKAGGISRGDVTWQANQMETGLQNKIYELRRQQQSANLPATEYQRIQREIQDQSIALNTLRENRGSVEARAKEGERSITIGAIPISVYFGGQQNPNISQIQSAVKDGAQQGMTAALNEYQSGNKY